MAGRSTRFLRAPAPFHTPCPLPDVSRKTRILSIISPTVRPARRSQRISEVAERLDTVLEVDNGSQGLFAVVETAFSMMEIAESEIEFAQFRHGEKPVVRDETGKVVGPKGRLWRSFRLLAPTGEMSDRAEFVYRAHCIQILDRVAAREDTREASDAEMMLALGQASMAAPLKASAAGLYLRLFARAFPAQATQIWGELDRSAQDYDRLYSSQIDEDEAWLRRKARQDWRDSRYLDEDDD